MKPVDDSRLSQRTCLLYFTTVVALAALLSPSRPVLGASGFRIFFVRTSVLYSWLQYIWSTHKGLLKGPYGEGLG